MARKTDEDRKRSAARQRAEASRIRHAQSGKPPADIVDAAIAEATVRILEAQGWRTVDGISQMNMTLPVKRLIIETLLILEGERGYNRRRSVEALTARFRRPIRRRRIEDPLGASQAS